MQFFFLEFYSHIDKNSGEKSEGMFLVKRLSKGTYLIHRSFLIRAETVKHLFCLQVQVTSECVLRHHYFTKAIMSPNFAPFIKLYYHVNPSQKFEHKISNVREMTS